MHKQSLLEEEKCTQASHLHPTVCWVGVQHPGGQLQPVLMQPTPQLSFKTWGWGGGSSRGSGDVPAGGRGGGGLAGGHGGVQPGVGGGG